MTQSKLTIPEINKKPADEDYVNVFVDANVDLYGRIAPDGFRGLAVDKTSEGIRDILRFFSFPSLNIVFSAAARLMYFTDHSMFRHVALDDLEVSVSLRALDKDGNEAPEGSLRILGIDPFETEAETVVVEGLPDPVGGTQIEFSPDIGAILKKIEELQGKAPDTSQPNDPDTLEAGYGAMIAGVAAVAAEGLKLAFGKKSKPPKNRRVTQITQMASFKSATEFCWYLTSFGEVKKDGTHFGTAFLQVSRDVTHIEVTATILTDWKLRGDKYFKRLPNQNREFKQVIPIYHGKVPDTPTLSDLNSAGDMPIMVPRSDVRALLGVTDDELNDLIRDGKLDAFGADLTTVTKGSLIRLIGI